MHKVVIEEYSLTKVDGRKKKTLSIIYKGKNTRPNVLLNLALDGEDIIEYRKI